MNNFIEKIKKLYSHDWVKLLSVFVFFGAFASLVYLPIDKLVSLDDPLFHIRFAQILRERGFGVFQNFHWIYFSNMSENQTYFIYYNFLFYLVLMGFTFFSSLIVGLKVYGIIFISLAFSSLYFFLSKIKEKNAFIWTVLFFILFNNIYISRFLTVRPFALAPALLLFELYFLYRKKYVSLFFLALIYFFWHTATFFFVPGVAVLYFIFENFYGRKFDWKIIISTFSAVLLAILVTACFAPGLFTYMKDIIFGVYWDTIFGKKVGIAEGVELYPLNTFDFVKTNVEIIILFTLSVVIEIFRYISLKKGTFLAEENEVRKLPLRGTLFFLSILFFAGMFMSARNKDFFIFFAAAYITICINDALKSVKIKEGILRKALPASLTIILVYLTVSSGLFMQDEIASNPRYDRLKGAAQWLDQNVPPKSVIFNARWDFFPQIFFYNSNDYYYVAGIEPRFLYDYDNNLYWLWFNITNHGYVCDQEECDNIAAIQAKAFRNNDQKSVWYKNEGDKIADIIRKDFKSQYIISSVNYKDFEDIISNSDRFEKVYQDMFDGPFRIYKVN